MVVLYMQGGRNLTVGGGKLAVCREVDKKRTADWQRRAAMWTGKRQQSGGGEQRGGDGLCVTLGLRVEPECGENQR